MRFIIDLLLFPVYAMMPLLGSDNPILMLIGAFGMICYIVIAAAVSTAIIVGMFVSGIHMLGIILFEWIP